VAVEGDASSSGRSPTTYHPPPPRRASDEKGVGDQLAPKYERGMSKYPLGQYRDRVGTNVEMVYRKVVKKA